MATRLTYPLLREVLPQLVLEIAELLPEIGRADLVPQLEELRLRGTCNCGDHFCGSIYTRRDRPADAEILEPKDGMMNLDIDSKGRICGIEILYRDDYRAILQEWLAQHGHQKR